MPSWEAGAVYHAGADLQAAEVAVADIPSPADIGVDLGRERVLILVFTEDRAELITSGSDRRAREDGHTARDMSVRTCCII
ncbi:hypothetical protein SAMN02745121_03296 [Nannocystis exedens]|uniref:Uncharacterized protein n=1 Tax=Nannocystis exedens TaxID=54 RepID=A0A1I1YFN2_9BACT|nr:hypothetical protein [Nannocystis exedens]PCC71946.1 hypothetical protein NAEX_05025 [Nannocystis exedens]SFE16913.1 hypothetical protein SAMN02745121_03296 [Nannocystis exedens]